MATPREQAEWVLERLLTLGGPGSGRYPKGSGKNSAEVGPQEVDQQIKRIVDRGQYTHYGVRVDNNPSLVIGQVAPASNDWSNDQAIPLKGTAAVDVRDWKRVSNYSGRDLILLGSQESFKGTDKSEIVLPEAVVLAKWTMGEGFWARYKALGGPGSGRYPKGSGGKNSGEIEHSGPTNDRQAVVKDAIRRGDAHLVTEDEFLNYHNTGFIEADAYKRYEAGDLAFIQKKDFGTLLDTREVNGQSVEIRLQTEPAVYSKRTVAAPDAERDRLYAEFEAAAKALGTTPMMAGIDLGHGSEKYNKLMEFEKRWIASGSDWVRDAHGNAVNYSSEEMQAKGLAPFSYTVGAFVGDKTVGYSGDEFGASGVYVARDYQRHGIGTTLLKTYLEKSGRLAKGNKLGQMTPAGQQLTRELHRQLVKDAKLRGLGSASSGNYGHAGRPGEVGGSGSQTSSPAFKEWFGKSQVVDVNGQPLVVYHGTNADLKDFHSGSHFGTVEAANQRAGVLEGFSRDIVHRDPGAFQILPVYLSIQHPLRLPDLASLDDETGRPLDEVQEEWNAKSQDEQEYTVEHGGEPQARAWENYGEGSGLVTTLREHDIITRDEFWDHQYAKDREIYALLTKKGYDGIVYKNAVEHAGHDSWIVFHPNQVKSAIGNSGAFSRKTKLITGGDVAGHEFHGNQWTSGGYTPLSGDASDTGRFVFKDGEPHWEQSHAGLVREALFSWKGDASNVRIHMGDIERGDQTVPSSGSGKQMRAQAEALMYELQHHAKTNEVPLYRAAGPALPGGLQSWTENRSVAQKFLKQAVKSGFPPGQIYEAAPGTVRGIRYNDYLRDPMSEQEWISIPKARYAGDVLGHEFHGNQWTVQLSMGRLSNKYPDVAQRYQQDSGTEMGSIGSHTAGVGEQWPQQISRAELKSISDKWGSDVGKLMHDTLALHDIGKGDAVSAGDKHLQHTFTTPILTDILTKEGYRAKDIALAVELVNHDLLGQIMQGSTRLSEQQLADTIAEKAARVGMNAHDFATLQLAVYHADAGSYPYIRESFMKDVGNGKWAMRDDKLRRIKALAVGHLYSRALMLCEAYEERLRTLGDVEGHPFHGNQWTNISQVDLDLQFPMAGNTVDGRTVGDEIDNTSSISASLTDYEILDDVREVKISDFEDDGKPSFYSATEEARVKELAAQIKASQRIDPLIVVIDGSKRGPYVLEGGHRFDALKLIGAKSFPALVVIDTEKLRIRTAGDVAGHEFHGNQWTGDRLRDDAGKSIVYYHGTRKAVGEFTGPKVYPGGEMVRPLYLTPSPQFASIVAGGQTGAAVQGFYVHANKVFDATNPEHLATAHSAGILEHLTTTRPAVYQDFGAFEINQLHDLGFDAHYEYESRAISPERRHIAVYRPDRQLENAIGNPRRLSRALIERLRALGDVAGHEFHGNQWTGHLMFHGTSDQMLNAIKKDGLKPGGGKGGDAWALSKGYQEPDLTSAEIAGRKASVFLTDNVEDAANYAKIAEEMNPGSKGIVLAIDVPDESWENVVGDELSWANRFKGRIPPEWIKGRVLPGILPGIRPGVIPGDRLRIQALEGSVRRIYLVLIADEAALETLGDIAGHEFHGNQWTDANQPTGSDEPFGDASNPIEMFHGTTSAALTAIRAEGLIPAKGQGGDAWAAGHLSGFTLKNRPLSVYMADDERDAVQYARYASTQTGGHPIVLTVKVPGRYVDDIKSDEEMYGGKRFEGRILPEWIVSARTLADVATDRKFARGLSQSEDRTIYLVIVVLEPKTLGGPGSGRYPKGSGKEDGAISEITGVDWSSNLWGREFNAPDDFYYHVTLAPQAKRIVEAQEFKPGHAQFMGRAEPTEHSDGRVFLTDRNGVFFWVERVEQHAFDKYDDPPKVVVLRVPKSSIPHAKSDEAGTRDARAPAYYVEGIVKLKTAGGPGSGNFGHAGRPGEVGGAGKGQTESFEQHPLSMGKDGASAVLDTPHNTPIGPDFYTAFNDLGIKTSSVDDLESELVDKLNFADNEHEPMVDGTLSPEAVAGMHRAFEDLQQQAPDLFARLKNDVTFTAASLPDRQLGAFTSAYQGPSGKFYLNIVMNTNFDAGDFKTSAWEIHPMHPASVTIASQMAKGLIGDAAVKEFYRGVLTHEIGHYADIIGQQQMQGRLVDTLLKQFKTKNELNATTFEHMSKFLREKLSDYSVAGPGEAAAEVFTSVVQHRHLPKELVALGHDIRLKVLH